MGVDPVSIAIMVALQAATMAITAMQKIEGPRLTDLSVTVADYGTPLNYLRGTARLECPCFYAEPITETKTRRKTKGGKYSEYVYSGTCAIVVADHEVQTYLKIWLDRRLGYDATSGVAEYSLNLGDYIRFYYGTSDQEPDERMLATIEAEEGEGTCPAYLDVAYIFAEDLPLQPFGNRFPQWSVLVSSETNVEVAEATEDSAEIVLVGYQTIDNTGENPGDTEVFALTGGLAALPAPGDTVLLLSISGGQFFGPIPQIGINSGWDILATGTSTDATGFLDYRMTLFAQRMGETPETGFTWTADLGIIDYPSTGWIVMVWRGVYEDILDTDVVIRDNYDATVNEPDPITISFGTTYEPGVMCVNNADQISFTLALRSESGNQVLVLGAGHTSDSSELWLSGNFTNIVEVDAFGSVGSSGGINWGLPVVAGGGTTLGAICRVVSLAARMNEADFDYTLLDQPIPGYHWTQGTGKAIIEPLLQLYDSDVRPNGFLFEGVKRGRGMVSTPVPYENFVRPDEKSPSYEVKLASDSDLPFRVYATFADLNADHQPNTAVFQRSSNSILTNRELSFDLTTLSIDADDIQPLVEVVFRRSWIGSMALTFGLPPFYLDLMPCSVRDIELEGDLFVRARVKHMTIAPNRVITVEWERDRESVPDPDNERDEFDMGRESPGAPAAGRPPSELFQPVPSELFVIDTALLSDADDRTTPFLLIGSAPSTSGDWPGADVGRSDSGAEDSFEFGFAGFSSASASTWGTVNGVLPDAIPGLMDEGSELVVQLGGDYVLESVSQAALLADITLNQAIVGEPGRWEILQFRDAVLQSEGEWMLTGLIRGQRGTERNISAHEAGDLFILSSSLLVRKDIGAGEIGDRDWYKVATLGVIDFYDEPESILFAAEAHRPYSVAHLELERDPITGDITIRWLRRTRVGGSSFSGQDVPLGETAEQYRIRFYSGDTVVRTEDLDWSAETGQPEFLYTSYEQIEDFGGLQDPLDHEVVQLSPSLGIEGVARRESA